LMKISRTPNLKNQPLNKQQVRVLVFR
jgi:hypothetical protein